MSITAIVTAMQDRNAAWLGVYKAFSDEPMAPAKLAAELNSENSAWGAANLGKASAQTIINYRRAWALASTCPEAAANVGKDGQIHKAISYATAKGVSTKSVDTWTKHTAKAIAASEDPTATLTAALKELRELGKAKQASEATEETPAADVVEITTPDDPDEMVREAIALMQQAMTVAGSLSIDLVQDAEMTAHRLFDLLMSSLDEAA